MQLFFFYFFNKATLYLTEGLQHHIFSIGMIAIKNYGICIFISITLINDVHLPLLKLVIKLNKIKV